MKHPEDYKFYKMYGNLPIPVRKEIVTVVDNEPMSFSVIKLELDNETQMGYKALDSMLKMKLLE
jgi:hypothetical protein